MPETARQSGHAVIAGFGVPGRMVAEVLESRGTPCTIIETNSATVNRATKPGRRFICGDASDPKILRAADVETASLMIVAIPDEPAALQATRHARQLNPTIRIITRTHYTSAGMEARQLGANDVVVAEQAVAREFTRILDASE
jgi:monovalent cation:H+ antiporter-2, CPA2 family